MSQAASMSRYEQHRQRVDHGRDHAERVLALAEHLDERDRLLVEQVYRHGLPAAEVARLLGVRPRTMQRRLARLVERMIDPMYRFVAAHLDLIPEAARAPAKRHFLQGQSQRDVARRLGITLHQVRQHIDAVRTLAEVYAGVKR